MVRFACGLVVAALLLPAAHTYDCPKKDLNYKAVYGNLATAEYCFKHAVDTLLADWTNPQKNRQKLNGSLLRFSFHDCGTYRAKNVPRKIFRTYATQCGGCNGSVPREFAAGRSVNFKIVDGERVFNDHNGLTIAHGFLFGANGRAAKIRRDARCATMSNADIISIAGYMGVVMSEGQPLEGCHWYPGRQDAPDANKYDDSRVLPQHTNAAAMSIELFKGYEMEGLTTLGFTWMNGRDNSKDPAPIKALSAEDEQLAEFVATISGAHTIGYNRKHAPSTTVQERTGLDNSDNFFDALYYWEVMRGDGGDNQGMLFSDRMGRCTVLPDDDKPLAERKCTKKDSPFAPVYQRYADEFAKRKSPVDGSQLFRYKFCQAYQAMSLISYKWPSDYAAVSKNFKFPAPPAWVTTLPHVEDPPL